MRYSRADVTEQDRVLGRKIQALYPDAWIPGVENGGIGMFVRLLKAHLDGGSEALSAGHEDLCRSVSGGAYSETLAILEERMKEVGL